MRSLVRLRKLFDFKDVVRKAFLIVVQINSTLAKMELWSIILVLSEILLHRNEVVERNSHCRRPSEQVENQL